MEALVPPQLPMELLIHILGLACSISHDTAMRISHISSWARKLAKTYVFGTVVRIAGSLYPFRGRLELSHKVPPSGCGEFVRHLWLETVDLLSSPREINLFRACPNVEDVAVSVNTIRTLLSLLDGPYSSPHSSAIRSLTLINHTPRTVFLVKPNYSFLNNVTHLRMLDLQQSAYVPLRHLPNLTHLALPFMHLRTTHTDGLVRLPDDLKTCSRIELIVLTIDHYDWLHRPWLHKGRYTTLACIPSAESPREKFRLVRDAAKARDGRVHVVLSPVMGDKGEHTAVCTEWAAAARGGESIWEKAVRLSKGDWELDQLPTEYPRPHV